MYLSIFPLFHTYPLYKISFHPHKFEHSFHFMEYLCISPYFTFILLFNVPKKLILRKHSPHVFKSRNSTYPPQSMPRCPTLFGQRNTAHFLFDIISLQFKTDASGDNNGGETTLHAYSGIHMAQLRWSSHKHDEHLNDSYDHKA